MNHHYIEANQFLELSCDIAESLLESEGPTDPYIKEPNGDHRLTDAAQETFNTLIDQVEGMLRRGGIHPDR